MKNLWLLCGFLCLHACGMLNQKSDDNKKSGKKEKLPTIEVQRAKENQFYAAGDSLELQLNRSISDDLEDVVIYRNQEILPKESYSFADKQLVVNNFFSEGKNDVSIFVLNANGEGEVFDYALWAGGNDLEVKVFDAQNQPIQSASVRVSLADAPEVFSEQLTDAAGSALFSNIPARTLLVEARKDDGVIKSLPIAGTVGHVELFAEGKGKPSKIINNDFSKGSEGWQLSSESVVNITEHAAETPPTGTASTELQNFSDTDPSMGLEDNGPNSDLKISTSGEGIQHAARAFVSQKGTTNIKVRFRFVTSEVPGGFFGSQYNDYFAVSVQTDSGHQYSGNSMNALGLQAFDTGGATQWFELDVPVSPEGETVNVKAEVANVADGLYDSALVIDSVAEQNLEIAQIKLFDIDNNPLTFLSKDVHPYFSGKTRIHASLKVKGNKKDSLKDFRIEIMQGGSVVAIAKLTDSGRSRLLKPFGSAGEITIANPEFLFEFQPAKDSTLNNTSLMLRAVAVSSKGEKAVKDSGSVPQLVRFAGANRYGNRDGAEGGDDWVRASVRNLIGKVSGVTYGDFSNMNGGEFPPHASHQDGFDLDGWYEGYNIRDEKTAAKMFTYLNNPTVGTQIKFVFVTYKRDDKNKFWQAIKDVILADGRKAKDVIRSVEDHATHFHWRFK